VDDVSGGNGGVAVVGAVDRRLVEPLAGEAADPDELARADGVRCRPPV
jgi:hypothetical protein